jgi:hypothetical protein
VTINWNYSSDAGVFLIIMMKKLLPNPDNVGNGLAGFRRSVDVDIDPSNFLFTRTYGQAPSNTSLTVTYTIGNGISDNVAAN